MAASRLLASRLLRPALIGLGLVLATATPSALLAAEAHDGHCAQASEVTVPAPVRMTQLTVAQEVGVFQSPCEQCPDSGCDGAAQCLVGGIFALDIVAVGPPTVLVISMVEPLPPVRVVPSFDPTPPTPPPNVPSVR